MGITKVLIRTTSTVAGIEEDKLINHIKDPIRMVDIKQVNQKKSFTKAFHNFAGELFSRRFRVRRHQIKILKSHG